MKPNRYTAGKDNGAMEYYQRVVIPFFMDEYGLKDHSIQESRDYIHNCVLVVFRAIDDPVKKGKTIEVRIEDMGAERFWEYINTCELTYFENFNGSFPAVKDHGYDKSKK